MHRDSGSEQRWRQLYNRRNRGDCLRPERHAAGLTFPTWNRGISRALQYQHHIGCGHVPDRNPRRSEQSGFWRNREPGVQLERNIVRGDRARNWCRDRWWLPRIDKPGNGRLHVDRSGDDREQLVRIGVPLTVQCRNTEVEVGAQLSNNKAPFTKRGLVAPRTRAAVYLAEDTAER